MTPIVIVKEKNTLTITVDGNTWNCKNEQTHGKFAGKVTNYTETHYPSPGLARAAALRHAKVNGWNIKEAQLEGWK